MDRKQIVDIVIDCIKEYFDSQDIESEVTEETPLFGKQSDLDSMGLVNIIIDIESIFLDEDYEISLNSEEAMSRRNSPFRNVGTLVEFIKEQIE